MAKQESTAPPEGIPAAMASRAMAMGLDFGSLSKLIALLRGLDLEKVRLIITLVMEAYRILTGAKGETPAEPTPTDPFAAAITSPDAGMAARETLRHQVSAALLTARQVNEAA